MEGNLGNVLDIIEREKGIPRQELLGLIETAVNSAFRKHAGRGQNFEAHIDSKSGEITAYIIKTIVDKVSNRQIQISAAEAKKIDPKKKIGDEIRLKIEASEFGRIAAQTAKQVIIQRIREIERDNVFKEFKAKEDTVVNGTVQGFVKNNVLVDIGKIEAIIPSREQIKKQKLQVGEYIKVYILKVEATSRRPQVIVSRTHPGLVKRLFELEVPEVYDKTVEIKQIVRDPGVRCKVAVVSHNDKVDPVGACVGVKGSRVQSIINELGGERMDLIAWSDDIKKYIENSLSPAKVQSVKIDEAKKEAYVTVSDDMLSLAIGKAGQNVRLAARLTNWHIDIKSQSQRKVEAEAKVEEGIGDLLKITGVGKKTAEIIYSAGFKNRDSLKSVNIDVLKSISGIGPKTAEKILGAIKKMEDNGK